MSTPSIQTLITQAQQVLNLKSSNEIRATLAAILANANVGTPLNPNLTTQQLWDEFYEIVRQPSDDIMSIITDQMMRMVFSPPAPGGAGADKQVIFNDMGVLAGDAGLVYNKTTDALTVTGLVTAGSAAITGDLTVDTSTLKVDSANNRVGIGTASPGAGYALDVVGGARITASNGLVIDKAGAGFVDFFNSGNAGANVGTSGTGGLVIYTANGIGGAYSVRHTIASDGVCTWSNVGGVAGTAMTLNSTGLGVGVAPSSKLDVLSAAAEGTIRLTSTIDGSNATPKGSSLSLRSGSSSVETARIASFNRFTNVGGGDLVFSTADSFNVLQTRATIDSSGNLLVGTTALVLAEKLSVNAGNSTGALVKNTGGATFTPFYVWNATTVGDGYFSLFSTEAAATPRGSISYNRAGGLVAYNTTSDYRSKDIIGPVSNSGSLIDSLKVYFGKMKGATIARPMLIAHEAQEVAPYAVTGTKDEVDSDGKDKYQQMDVSSFVPLLIAEIQSLRTRVQTLEAK